jgi:hypothetical protein
MAVSMENLRLREAAPTSVNVTVDKRSREYLTDREVERLHRGRQAESLWASGRHGYIGRLPPWPQGLRAGGTTLGRHRPFHRTFACTQGQKRGCQRSSDISAGKPRAAQAPARSPTVPCPSRKLYSRVAVMQAGKDWCGDDGPGALNSSS